MDKLNKLLQRQIRKYLGEPADMPEQYHDFLRAVSESYNHYEKDHQLLERSIEISSSEMIELHEKLKLETEQLRRAHEELKATEQVRLEKRLDEEKIKNLKEITAAVIEVQERERSFLSAELHDNINQILATAKLYLDTAIANQPQRMSLMVNSKEFIDNAMQEIRYLCKSLLPPLLSKSSLAAALEDMIHHIRYVNPLEIQLQCDHLDESGISEKMKVAIFRIIQEQLNNIFKYAQASTVIIELTHENDLLQLRISDNGVGFDPAVRSRGVGLQNIVSRTNLFNGEFELISSPGNGCHLRVAFHLSNNFNAHRLAS